MPLLKELDRRAFLGAAVATAALPLASCGSAGAGDAEFTLVAAHATSTDHFMHRSFLLFQEEIQERSDGRIQMKVFPNGVFGGDRELTEAMQLNTLHLAAPSSSPVAAFSPDMNVWDIPYLFESREQAYTVLDGSFGQRLLDQLTDVRIKGLGYWENGYRNLSHNTDGIAGPEDMAGIKLRTLENQTQIRAWNATGASATPMAFTEVYTGLQQGTIDAQENPLALIVTQRFYEVQAQVVLSEHVYTPSPLIMSQRFYDELPSELQREVEEAAQASVEYCREQSVLDDESSRQIIEDADTEVVELAQEGRDAFREIMRPVAEEYVESIVSTGTLDELQAAIEEAS
ncbi:MAG: TRAP transporter substrate-binding protein [Brachybacterium sp.]